MFLLIILSLQLLIAAATTVSSVEAKVPKILELVDVLFFQAFLLVPTPDKVANLRENLKEALNKKRTQEDVSLSGYSDSPLFDEAISMGFKRHA